MKNYKIIEKSKITRKILSNDNFLAIWDFIETNPNEVSQGSVVSISQKINISQPTISRFVKALGFNNYNDFRVYVTERNIRQAYGLKELHESKAENVSLNTDRITDDVYTHYRYSIDETMKNIKAQIRDLDDYIKTVINDFKNNHIFYGVGESGWVARYLAEALNKVGFNAKWINTVYDMLTNEFVFNHNNVNITIISNSFNTTEIKAVSRVLRRKNNLNIYAITASVDRAKECLPKAKKIFKVSFTNQKWILTPIGAKISSLMFADCVFISLVNKLKHKEGLYQTMINNIQEWNSVMENFEAEEKHK
ncbi:MurR/RpiR family transcriptional regulator [Mycoplasma corogypsi]|uniref:MurR/RpiR family transcriptional regulator n=1 Tax=Mycoplasma corogypsi TaxID=2106 RepID=UPI0038730F00